MTGVSAERAFMVLPGLSFKARILDFSGNTTYCMKTHRLQDNWNKLDLFIVITSIPDLLSLVVPLGAGTGVMTVFRIMRIGELLASRQDSWCQQSLRRAFPCMKAYVHCATTSN